MGHVSKDRLKKSLQNVTARIPVGSRWYHYRAPQDTYKILDIVFIESTEQVGVLYQAEYGERFKWVRDANDFLAEVDVDGQSLPRFVRV